MSVEEATDAGLIIWVLLLLKQDLSDDIFNSLTKALLAPDASGISWQPVRASAAGALSLLLQVLYFIIMASTPAGFEIIITGFELIRN
jgi:hypothetical protein